MRTIEKLHFMNCTSQQIVLGYQIKGHVTRTGDNRSARTVLLAKPTGRRPFKKKKVKQSRYKSGVAERVPGN